MTTSSFIQIAPRQANKAQLLSGAGAYIGTEGQRLLGQLSTFAQRSLNMVWGTPAVAATATSPAIPAIPNLYSPQEFLGSPFMGKRAKVAMATHGRLIAYLAGENITIDTSMIQPYTANDDGTVTVTVPVVAPVVPVTPPVPPPVTP